MSSAEAECYGKNSKMITQAKKTRPNLIFDKRQLLESQVGLKANEV